VDNEAAEKARSIKHLDQKRHAINQLAGRGPEGSTPAASTTSLPLNNCKHTTYRLYSRRDHSHALSTG
jgi:hypothetical protein